MRMVCNIGLDYFSSEFVADTIKKSRKGKIAEIDRCNDIPFAFLNLFVLSKVQSGIREKDCSSPFLTASFCCYFRVTIYPI